MSLVECSFHGIAACFLLEMKKDKSDLLRFCDFVGLTSFNGGLTTREKPTPQLHKLKNLCNKKNRPGQRALFSETA